MMTTPRRGFLPRFTLGKMMAIVAGFAGSFAIFGALTSAVPGIEVPGAIVLVILYDLLIYLVILLLRRLIKPREGDRPTVLLVVLAALVLTTCAGLPLIVLAKAFLGR